MHTLILLSLFENVENNEKIFKHEKVSLKVML